MGNSYYNNVTQWSKGEYAGANNTQDDIAVIAGKLYLAPDDHGDAPATATSLFIDANGAIPISDPEIDPHNGYWMNKGVIDGAGDVDQALAVSRHEMQLGLQLSQNTFEGDGAAGRTRLIVDI